PGWASISRGVLVCDECCSVHRSLGRHISIVKHLRHSAWPPTLLQQLHSSVRTGNLETCLRLLSLGAQANFFHPEKGTTPLHVAAKAGQTLQAELLVVYGADPGSPDVNGRTPIDYARNGHYIIPQMADSLDLSELAKAAKKKLQALSNRLFEELAMDVYDEVDRRENDAATRNQGRQKLARFNAREFATLIIDILNNLELSVRSQSDLDDQHDYDSVASDEDTDQEPLRSAGATRNNRARSMDSSDLSDGAVTLQEYLELKKALAASEAKVQQLMKVNSSLSDELRRLQREAFSMYEPGSALKPFGGPPGDELTTRLQPFHSTVSCLRASGSWRMTPSIQCTSLLAFTGLEGKRFLELGKEEDFHPELESLDGDLDPGLPSTEDVILKTEQVTKNIQELLRAAQEFKHDSFVPCSEKIHLAVTEMASLFPKRPALEPVRSSLRLLNASAYRLQSECRKTVPPEPGAPVDFQLLTQQVIQCAYDIAKAAKQLVTITTREKKQ
ncbi:hypothetical protein E2I00_004404, partial [Balaenoptera physalus]